MDGKKTHNFTLRLDDDLNDALTQIETVTEVSRSVLARALLRSAIQYYEECGHLEMPPCVIPWSESGRAPAGAPSMD